MTDTGAGRRAALMGGILAGVLLVGFVLMLLVSGPLPGDTDRFSLSADLLLAGFGLLTAWLLVGSAFWVREDPAWARHVRTLWAIPFLSLVSGFMLWIRLLSYKAFVGGDRVYFIGSDPYYHYRETLGIVRAFPRVPRFDPWTQFPLGTGTGQFGSLFDWGAAAYVVLTQGKGASEAYVQHVLGVYPAVLGAIIAIPMFFLAKRMLGTPAAVVATVTIAFLAGEFLERSLAGYSDHHVAEALFCLVSILGVYHAAMKGHDARSKLRDPKDVASWRAPLLWGVLGGIALAANFYAWPPAILFLAILTVWLTIVILLEDGQGGDARGYVFGAVVAFVTAGLLMVPAIDSTVIGEFNTYGILHPIASFGAALWLIGIHVLARWTRSRGISPWVVPGSVVLAALLVYGAVATLASEFYASLLWGLSWITGFGVQRTTFTIGEARPAEFFCSQDEQASCLQNDFGALAPLGVILLLILVGFAIFRRRPSDILLAIWSIVVFRAATTQVRFSYYLALNLALLVGWAAATIADHTGLTAALEGRVVAHAAAKGRKAKRVEATAREARTWQFAAVAGAFLLVLPGNVLHSSTSFTVWEHADIPPESGGFRARMGDVLTYTPGLDWMRTNTPDAGVDLGVIVKKPAPGTSYAYPPQSYGVITWWDYGHYIETIAQRPPVSNPFQQAAPFAAKFFTERDPTRADQMLDEYAGGKDKIRYVMIDDAIATGKWGAITVWAHSQNASRDVWADGQYLTQRGFTGSAGPLDLYAVGPEYTENMMGRLYDADGDGLGNYRLVWESQTYEIIGSVTSADGRLPCLHESLPGRGCAAGADPLEMSRIQPGQYLALPDGSKVYDTFVAPSLKIFERVPGAHLVGTAAPGERVTAGTRIAPQPDGFNTRGTFDYAVSAIAGPDGRFDITFPYSDVDPVSPGNGGTTLAAHVAANIVVASASKQTTVTVPDAAVLHGDAVTVTFS